MVPKNSKSTSARSKVVDIIDTATATNSKAPQVSNHGMLTSSKRYALSQSEARDFGITSSPTITKLK
jgi:hypothetical protein